MFDFCWVPAEWDSLAKITGKDVAEERDFGTVSSFITALCLGKVDTRSVDKGLLGCNILRVHNVKACKPSVMDAIRKAN
jgi:dihydropteroate synthase